MNLEESYDLPTEPWEGMSPEDLAAWLPSEITDPEQAKRIREVLRVDPDYPTLSSDFND